MRFMDEALAHYLDSVKHLPRQSNRARRASSASILYCRRITILIMVSTEEQ
jgi:hypothetical protein